jgi:hypothetical protein
MTSAFLQLVEMTASLGVTAVLEYMVFSWNPETLDRLRAAADCLVIMTQASGASERAARRDQEDPLLNEADVLAALALESVDDYLASPGRELARASMISSFDLPTLDVCTDDEYEPSLPAIVDWIKSHMTRDS